MIQPQNIFNGANHIYGGVVSGNDCVVFDIRSNHISGRAVGIHVVGAIL